MTLSARAVIGRNTKKAASKGRKISLGRRRWAFIALYCTWRGGERFQGSESARPATFRSNRLDDLVDFSRRHSVGPVLHRFLADDSERFRFADVGHYVTAQTANRGSWRARFPGLSPLHFDHRRSSSPIIDGICSSVCIDVIGRASPNNSTDVLPFDPALRGGVVIPALFPGLRPPRRTASWAIFDSSLRDEGASSVIEGPRESCVDFND